MKVATFFKTLNKKIKQYDDIAKNPFTISRPIILIWIEDIEEEKTPKDFE